MKVREVIFPHIGFLPVHRLNVEFQMTIEVYLPNLRKARVSIYKKFMKKVSTC